jgi:hypothetical protein
MRRPSCQHCRTAVLAAIHAVGKHANTASESVSCTVLMKCSGKIICTPRLVRAARSTSNCCSSAALRACAAYVSSRLVEAGHSCSSASSPRPLASSCRALRAVEGCSLQEGKQLMVPSRLLLRIAHLHSQALAGAVSCCDGCCCYLLCCLFCCKLSAALLVSLVAPIVTVCCAN